MRRLRIALVCAYPPSRRPLSEYAWHVVQSLRKSPRVERIDVLADRLPNADCLPNAAPASGDRVAVHRCWSFGGIDQPIAVVRMARRLDVDAVWFNLHLTSGGNTRASRFAGLTAPAAARCAGLATIVTLHNMLGFTDVRTAGPETNRLDVLGAHLATSLLSVANVACVLVPEYADLLKSRYGVRRVCVMPHGTLGSPAIAPAPDALGPHSLVAFGHFGSYKRLEPLIDVMADLSATGSAVTLTIAGTDSRHNPGYLARLQMRCRDMRNITFRGYVPESDVPSLFRASSCVLPYATMTGTSGVAVQSAMYGVPIIASDIPGFRSLERSGMRMTFFEWGSTNSLKAAILRVLASPALRVADASQNLAYCRRQTMDVVVDRYLDVIEGEVVGERRSATGSDRIETAAAPVPVAPR